MILSTLKLRPAFQKVVTFRHMSVVNLSDKSAVDKFLNMNDKSILYHTATWCPPCKMISPVYDQLSKTHSEVAFGKIDVDVNSETASHFQISSVPTFIFFNKEQIHGRFSGANQQQLEQLINELKES